MIFTILEMSFNILQFYKILPAKYIIEYNLKNISNCNHVFYRDTDFLKWSEFIKNNPCDKFKDIETLNSSTELFFFRKFFFILYYLYIEGGLFINDDIIIEPAFKELNLSNNVIIVESILKSDDAFIECIYSHKKSKFIELILNKLILKCKDHLLK
jgi:hypothetical protein